MRKSFVYAAGLMCLALSITDCQKELVDQTTPASEPNFELFAQPVTTKTANNGLDTKWVANDDINVFHAEAGSTSYLSDGQFIVKDIETGRFDGKVSTSLSADKSYDWYAFYPYSPYNKTPAGISKETFGYTTIGGTSQTQTGNGSRAHLAGESCPLYGIASNVASDKVPSIEINHLTSVIKVSVTNNSGEDLTVSSVSFTGTEDIVGTYYINFAASPVAYKSRGNAYVSSTASLTVANGEALANGSSADFYIALKPFTATAGSTLKLAVNGYEKTLTLDNDITFTAGHIKPLNFNFDKKVLDCVTLPWSIDGTGGSSIWKNTIGLSQKGLGNDYANTNKPYLTKFDTDKDYVQIKYDSPAAKVKFGVKMFGTSTSTMTVQGSADGTAFSDIEAFTIPKKQNGTYSFTTSKSIDASYRYIRLSFTKGGNVGLGAVEITKESTDPVISTENIIGVSAHGVENQTLVYSISNGVDGAVLTAVGDGTVVTTMCENDAVTYMVAANKTASDREGTITLTYAKDGVTLTEKTVKVQQLAPVFKVSRASVELDATKGAQTTITVTSDFDWMANASTSAGFSFSPDTYTWQEGGKETVTITASNANASEAGTATLGTITFSNIETGEELIVTVTQKSSYVAPATDTEATYGIDAFSGGTSGSGSALTIINSDSNISLSGVGYRADTHVKIYANQTLTITPQNGKTITNIVITATTSTYVGTWKASSASVSVSGTSVTWTGTSTAAVTLTNTASKQARITNVVVTYK